MSDLVIGHLYPEQLNIYADRGNIAVVHAPLPVARDRLRGGRLRIG